jgi:UDP-N-acetylglucosamine 4-epimerase
MNIELTNKRILVTGGAGFIGSNICEYLLKYNNKVRCLDNLSTGKMENIEHLFANLNFELVDGDIRNIVDCNKARKGVEYVLYDIKGIWEKELVDGRL